MSSTQRTVSQFRWVDLGEFAIGLMSDELIDVWLDEHSIININVSTSDSRMHKSSSCYCLLVSVWSSENRLWHSSHSIYHGAARCSGRSHITSIFSTISCIHASKTTVTEHGTELETTYRLNHTVCAVSATHKDRCFASGERMFTK